ncbi:aminotransferase DegT [bacterium]|nr:aminotransferase DegT [bacterium]|tara:strand:+ start:2800 stop:3993 length:1194 start_codon:yes stop_codon:yes gene_type:complete
MNKDFIASDLISKIENVIGYNKGNKNFALHEPTFKGSKASSYLEDCIASGWVSSNGKWVVRFEEEIKRFTGAKYAIAVTNGTVGLRLALFIVGVKPGDEVIVPPLTFVASANAISHLGAYPNFVDIENKSLGICPESLSKYLKKIIEYKSGSVWNKKTGRRIAAILPVHVFGNPCEIIEISKIAHKYNLPIVEDAAEALGSKLLKKHCGTYGDIGIFSFNGNKIITTGGGGVLITDNKFFAEKAKYLSTTAKEAHPWEMRHHSIGWNDRMPNLNAALGVSQIELLDKKLEEKRLLSKKYQKALSVVPSIEFIGDPLNESINHWLISIKFIEKVRENAIQQKLEVLTKAHQKNIFLRPAWELLNKLPMYKSMPSAALDVAEEEAPRILSLPSSPQLID